MKINDIQIYEMEVDGEYVPGLISPVHVCMSTLGARVLYEFIEVGPDVNEIISSGFGTTLFKCKHHPIEDWGKIRKVISN